MLFNLVVQKEKHKTPQLWDERRYGVSSNLGKIPFSMIQPIQINFNYIMRKASRNCSRTWCSFLAPGRCLLGGSRGLLASFIQHKLPFVPLSDGKHGKEKSLSQPRNSSAQLSSSLTCDTQCCKSLLAFPFFVEVASPIRFYHRVPKNLVKKNPLTQCLSETIDCASCRISTQRFSV